MGFKIKKKSNIFGFSAKKEKEKNITRIAKLLDEEEFIEALPLLEEAIKKYPTEEILFRMLAEVGNELQSPILMIKAFGKLIQFQPNDADLWCNLAVVYGMGGYPALVSRTFREFLRRFPSDSRKKMALETIEMAEEDMEGMFEAYQIPKDKSGLELAVLHDKVQLYMNQQEYERAIRTAQELIRKAPYFIAPYNNLSLVYYMKGEPEKAVETAKLVIEKEPENFHALGNIVRFLVFLNRKDEARNYANRLRGVESVYSESYVKKIEALAFLGDDESVVEIYREIVEKEIEMNTEGYVKNLVAFSFYQLGDEEKAEELWEEASDEDFEDADENLEEMEFDDYERDVFSFSFSYWIPPSYIGELAKATKDIKENEHFDANLKRKTNEFFDKNPHFVGNFPTLLERGDRRAKEFVIKVTGWSEHPQAVEILRDFALGKSGSDELRNQAAFTLRELDAFPKKAKMWIRGEHIESDFKTFKVVLHPVYEKKYPIQPKAKELIAKGIEATHAKKLDDAEQFYRQALEINPDHPVLLNNLMMLREQRNEKFDMFKETEEMYQRFPDYFFSGVTLARLEVRRGNLERAKELAEKLEDREEWHLDEFKLWSKLQIEICLKGGLFDGARSWLKQMQNMEEDMIEEEYINQAEYIDLETDIIAAELRQKFSGGLKKLFGRSKKKKK